LVGDNCCSSPSLLFPVSTGLVSIWRNGNLQYNLTWQWSTIIKDNYDDDDNVFPKKWKFPITTRLPEKEYPQGNEILSDKKILKLNYSIYHGKWKTEIS
jgi:hypothetical protein